MFMKRAMCGLLVLAVAGMSAMPAWAAETDAKAVTDVEKKGVAYLLKQQDADGAWMPQTGPAVTALVVRALLQSGKGVDDPAVAKGLAFIEKFRKDDGGYYGDAYVTYSSAIVLSTFGELPEAERANYKDRIEKLQTFLKSIQSAEGTKDDTGKEVNKDHPWYGGWGYAGGMLKAKRPDLSNTHFVIEALRDTGVPASDPSIQKALLFISRCQALSETNDQPWAKGRSEGGFIYSMRWNPDLRIYGESFAPNHKDRDGNEVLTTYGSITYAGLKSYIYADLKKDDPRVKAVINWVSNNFTLETNPGVNSDMGLYYYYHTFAKGLSAYGEPTIKDAKGVKRDWRAEYVAEMKERQQEDGSFVNKVDRWMESNPVIPTSYVVLGLQEMRK